MQCKVGTNSNDLISLTIGSKITMNWVLQEREIFYKHEADFYEGLAKTFNDVYVVYRQQTKMIKIIDRSFEYLSKAAPSVISQSAYLIEDDVKADEIVLRKVVVHQNGRVCIFDK